MANELQITGSAGELFENITQDKVDEIRELILENLQLYFPRVVVQNLSLDSRPDQNLVQFELKYAVSETNIEDEVAINFEV